MENIKNMEKYKNLLQDEKVRTAEATDSVKTFKKSNEGLSAGAKDGHKGNFFFRKQFFSKIQT